MIGWGQIVQTQWINYGIALKGLPLGCPLNQLPIKGWNHYVVDVGLYCLFLCPFLCMMLYGVVVIPQPPKYVPFNSAYPYHLPYLFARRQMKMPPRYFFFVKSYLRFINILLPRILMSKLMSPFIYLKYSLRLIILFF